jgi:hypothetical protein
MSLSGHKPIQDAKAEALRNSVKSGPISEQRLRDSCSDTGNFRQVHANDALEFTAQSGIGGRGTRLFGCGRFGVASGRGWWLELIQRAADLAVAVLDKLLIAACLAVSQTD